MTLSPSSIQMEFSAAFVDEWVRSGVRHAVIAPGSRSSALALALLTDARIDVSMRLDERSAAFFALGIALSTMTPVVMLTTSGTAAAEVHAAVIESDLAQVPLIIATADRPVELHDVHAPQTVRQSNLFANALRYFLDLAVPSEETRPYWRSFASRLVAEATKGAKGAGPVQVNIA
ncbi:MAG TPA: thiamine pyrophosphate-binding protein, partial [Acidimicrobiales bacterium]|nr:thiamine pyrophosphate-binding protein [Acidimicrobiales bacterium]